jgi:hypothetical protein
MSEFLISHVVFEPEANPQTGGGDISLSIQVWERFDPRGHETLGEAIDRLWHEVNKRLRGV